MERYLALKQKMIRMNFPLMQKKFLFHLSLFL